MTDSLSDLKISSANYETSELSIPDFVDSQQRQEYQSIKFYTPNKAAKWRVDTFYTKEPDTINWINSFETRDILIDIGANVGMYSVYAAAARGVVVIAVEPESQNYALLNGNIFLNHLDDKIIAFPYAISDHNSLEILNLTRWGAAGSCHAAGDPIGFDGSKFSPVFKQGVISVSLSQLINNFSLNSDCHLKIDVDGIEDRIINGSKELFKERFFKTLLVEINQNLEQHRLLVEALVSFGYFFNDAQVNNSVRKSGPFKNCGNYIFHRKDLS